MNLTFMPSAFGQSKLKWKELDPKERTLIVSKQEYFNVLSNEIRKKINQNKCFRSAVVFFKTIEDLK
jgi:hypothetical protein